MTPEIRDYLDLVTSGTVPMCNEQKQLAQLIENAFAFEDLRVDEAQLARYMGLQKHFPYKLLPWEKFCFALHNCVYDADGELRWPELDIVVGRGAGKNGYLSFEDFALITPINGVKNYDIDIFAMSEDQAKTSFEDIVAVLESNETYFKKFFYWTKEIITNLKTESSIRYHTSSFKSADGGRPGKVDNDEVHAYQDARLMDVGKTGLGKKRFPRQTKISTMGDVRDGPLDRIMATAERVLSGELPDNGVLYFICRLDSDEEIDKEECWGKANPSLYDPNRPQLLKQIRREYADYKLDPISNASFATKRMNRPQGNYETIVTEWENIMAACQPVPPGSELRGRACVAAIDYASTQDFLAAGILWNVNGKWIFKLHSWCCLQSKGLPRIKFPIREAEARGELTLINEVEIPPELPLQWIRENTKGCRVLYYGIDNYRYALMAKTFKDYGILPVKEGGNLKMIYTPEQSKIAPIIASAFIQHLIAWGDSMMMRWYTNNATRKLDKKGNITFEKIEPKTRKTDGFMAFVGCMILAHMPGVQLGGGKERKLPPVFVY